MSIKITPSLNEAQLAFLDFLTEVKTEKELDEIRRMIATYLLAKIRKSTKDVAKELGTDTKEGHKKFVAKNHKRTPYK
jgi:hypothetical protein